MRQLLILLCLIVTPFTALHAQEDRTSEGDIIIGKTYSIESKILNEKQYYKVMLPHPYDANPTVQYNIIYVLDGYSALTGIAYTAMDANYGWNMLVPNSIVVGIGSRDRVRDYTPSPSVTGFDGKNDAWLANAGGGETYRQFLKNEFIPHIESHYRSNGHRTLIGHSIAGLFVLGDVLSEDPLFQNYVAIDPSIWYADMYLAKKLAQLPDGSLAFSGNLYISNALNDSSADNRSTPSYSSEKNKQYLTFLELFKQKKPNAATIKMQGFPEETHGSVVPISVHEGLRYTFAGYAPPQPTDVAMNPSLIIDHYRTFSKRAGAVFIPDERDVDAAAGIALKKNMNSNALELYQLNVKNYPDSGWAWWRLGEFHEKTENPDEALAAFSHLLTIDPTSVDVREKVASFSR